MRPRSPGRCIALAAVLALATARAGYADDAAERPRKLTRKQAARASALRQRGLEHYLSRDYSRAAGELMEAYRIDKRPETLLGWGESVRESGDCELASRIYQRLLAKTGDEKLTAQAEAGLAACAGAGAGPPRSNEDPLAIDGAGAAEPGEEVVEASEPTPPLPSPPPNPTTTIEPAHTASYVLLGTGAALALGGLVAYASAADGSGQPGATHAQITSARSRGDWQRLIGASVAVTGATVALIGILRYRGEDSAARDHRVAVAPYFAPSGGGVVLGGRF